jgi:hypothetical protein
VIGYYVHHHGDGHRQRAIAIAQALECVTLMGTGLVGKTNGLSVLDLPDDRLEDTFSGVDGAERPSCLHYAPINHEGIRARVAAMSCWIAQERPRLIVVDVSVEVAMLARLASVPTVYVRLNGRRLDLAHLDAFRGAAALLAPFHEALEDEDTPDWVRAKTFYAPCIVRSETLSQTSDDGCILVVVGRGGGVSDGNRWAEAARAASHHRWRVIGPCTIPEAMPPNLELAGWVDDAETQIGRAKVIVGAAGDGVVSAVLSGRRPFICLPEPRPFEEQVSKARGLAAAGGALVPDGWPQPLQWSGLIGEAITLAHDWPSSLSASVGPAGVAEWLEALPATPHSSRTCSG